MQTTRRQLSAALFALVVQACSEAPPDIASLAPIRAEDTRVVALLREADRDAERDPSAAARTLREFVLPRARANARAAAELHPTHPRAQALASDLRSLLDERCLRLERYADALARDDLVVRIREVRAQRELEDDMGRLERRFEAIERAPPPTRAGCSR